MYKRWSELPSFSFAGRGIGRTIVLGLGGFALLLVLVAGCKKAQQTVHLEPTPIPSPFEDRLLFTSSGQLYLSNLGGDQVEKLGEAGKNTWFPAVSPDSAYIAYWSTAYGANELWLYDVAHQKRTQLTFFDERQSSNEEQNFNLHNAPAWSEDSQTIAFSHRGQIWQIHRSGFNLETLIRSGKRFAPAWSPDGKWLAFVTERNQARNLFIWNRDSGEEWPLTNFPAGQNAGSPAWSPDGSQLAFTVSTLENADIWVVDKDGRNPTRLTRDGHSNSPDWSADGKRIAFASGRQDPYAWEIWAMNRDGSGQFAVTRQTGFSPAWIKWRRQLPVEEPLAPVPENTVAAVKPAAVAAFAVPQSKASVAATPAGRKQFPMLTAMAPTPMPTRMKTILVLAAPTMNPKPVVKTAAKTFTIPTPVPTAVRVIVAKATLGPTPLPTAKPVLAVTAKTTPALAKTAVTPVPATAAKTPAAAAKTAANTEDDNFEAYEGYADKDQKILPENSAAAQHNRIVLKPNIDFYFAKDLIKASSFGRLKELAAKIDQYPDATLVVESRIKGPHWFKTVFPLLVTLSRARANSVLRHLIVNEKIRQINVTAIGEGDAFPSVSPPSKEKPLLLVVVY